MTVERSVAGFSLEEYFFDQMGYTEARSDVVLLRTLDAATKGHCSFAEPTILIDLERDEADLYQALSSRARHSISAAGRMVQITRAESIDQRHFFFELYTAFAREKGLPVVRPGSEDLDIYMAVTQLQDPVHMCAFIPCSQERVYRYRYSVAIRKSQANAAIVWKALLEAREKGFRFFDLGGVLPHGIRNRRLAGIDSFKRQFGGAEQDVRVVVRANNMLLSFALRAVAILFRFPPTQRALWNIACRCSQ